MRDAREGTAPNLPGNHGQFGEGAATEAYKPLRATQKISVKPVVPRHRPQLWSGPGRPDPKQAPAKD